MSRENTHIYINNTAHNIADYTQIQIIYKRWLVKYLHAFNCRIDWFVCYFFFILDETEGKVISINLEEIYINRFQEIERFILTEVETFDIIVLPSCVLILVLRSVKEKSPSQSGTKWQWQCASMNYILVWISQYSACAP